MKYYSMKRLFSVTVLAIAFLCCESIPAYAARRTCSYPGCDSIAKGGSYYCTTHGCHYKGCTRGALSDSIYCSTHTCHHKDCNNKVVSISSLSGGRYCSLHTCSESGCYEAAGSGGKCSKHETASASSKVTSSSKKATTSSKAYSSKKKSSSTSSSKSSLHSYDDGYEAIYNDDDYDEERYKRDSEYAAGVDDAMDELDW